MDLNIQKWLFLSTGYVGVRIRDPQGQAQPRLTTSGLHGLSAHYPQLDKSGFVVGFPMDCTLAVGEEGRGPVPAAAQQPPGEGYLCVRGSACPSRGPGLQVTSQLSSVYSQTSMFSKPF